jgi:uncharacterized protein
MNNRKRLNRITIIAPIAILMLFSIMNTGFAQYEAMKGVESTNAVFDFRIGDPQVALAHLGLIHTMIEDQAMVVNDTQPEMVIVFIGPSVRLISTDHTGLDQDQQQHLNALAEKISKMDQDGIRFEICMTSAPAFNIDPDTILPEITKVENGWISVIGYQQRDYAYVANF